MTNSTREQYLITAADYLLTNLILPETTQKAPVYQLSIGFPSGAKSTKAIGQCWYPKNQGPANIFINPTVNNTPRILDVLLHELIHATLGPKAGHGPKFKQLALATGLEGKMTQTTASPELSEVLQDFIQEHGDIPHQPMQEDAIPPNKPQQTRSVRMECNYSPCAFKFSANRSQLAKLPPQPLCPACAMGTLIELPPTTK